jgi:hypothetical protein
MHAHTEPRTEYELTENWYHDAYRADFECFMGRCGPFNPAELAHFISTRTAVAYQQGMRFPRSSVTSSANGTSPCEPVDTA